MKLSFSPPPPPPTHPIAPQLFYISPLIADTISIVINHNNWIKIELKVAAFWAAKLGWKMSIFRQSEIWKNEERTSLKGKVIKSFSSNSWKLLAVSPETEDQIVGFTKSQVAFEKGLVPYCSRCFARRILGDNQ